MAAYAALVSVMHIIDNLENHPRPPISLRKNQVYLLTQKITFLQEFLEVYNPHLDYSKEADPLESRIADAAYAAEDVIESHIVDQITNDGKKMSSNDSLYEALEKVIEDMALIEKEAKEIKEAVVVKHQLHIKSTSSDSLISSSSSIGQKISMVGAGVVSLELKDKLTSDRLALQIISIVGMGGSGKTTLARNIYQDGLIKEHFHICAWATISQEYSIRKILVEVLEQLSAGGSQYLSEGVLGEMLHKYLYGRKYLIVLDDMWTLEAWDRVRWFLPDNQNGSRIVITSRLSNLASELPNSHNLRMKLLDEADSWDLLSKTIFGEKGCPLELEEIGKKIGKSCKGLPLSIVVVGGILAKSKHTRELWQHIKENLNSIVNLKDDEHCLKIFHMSYKQLPVYLKPCFLYMGVFDEDDEIELFFLTRVWVTEGFLKPIHGKSLEEVTQKYVEELVDRNLLLVEKRNKYGKLTHCKMHDLLRDLSLREAQKVKFLCVLGEQSIHDIPQGINSQRRIASTLLKYPPTPLLQSLASASLVRSLIGLFPDTLEYNFRLLRLSMHQRAYTEDILLRLVNLRVIVFRLDDFFPKIPSSISFLWNLQTVVIQTLDDNHNHIFDIWKLPQLRNVIAHSYGTLFLPDPLSGDNDMHMDEVLVLKNLHILYIVTNFNFSEGVIKRIPNIKKLKLYYDETSRGDNCLNYLSCLHNLETLRLCYSDRYERTHLVSFPYSLMELTLEETNLHWEDMQTKIGSLPLLQVLKLKENSFIGSEWETFEGQFPSLKFLLVEDCCDLEYWKTDSYTHFPRLEHLVLRNFTCLMEIPLSIGDITTLQSITLYYCNDSAKDSARRILEEQEELGNEGFQLEIDH